MRAEFYLTSNGSMTLYPEGVPEAVEFALNWNPPPLKRPSTAAGDLPAHVGYTRPAAFYDKHLAPQLILKDVVYLDTLVSSLERTVDQAIQDASSRHLLPKNKGTLSSRK
jgi:hypothetical protein